MSSQTVKRIVGYIRVSTDKQEISPELQKEKIQSYCQLHDLALVGIHEDIGISAKNIAGRPGFKSALELVKSDAADGLLLYKLDRGFRNTIEALSVAEELKDKGKALISICEQLDTSNAMGTFFFTLMAGLATMERGIISERTRAAMQSRIAAGVKYGGGAGYGKKLVQCELVSNPAEQATVKLVHRLKELKHTSREIVQVLAHKGVTNRRGKPYAQSQVVRMARIA